MRRPYKADFVRLLEEVKKNPYFKGVDPNTLSEVRSRRSLRLSGCSLSETLEHFSPPAHL